MNNITRVLIIIPAYNEAENILNTINDIDKGLYENVVIDYVVINDCSTDETLKLLQDNKKNYINIPINLGIGGGMQTGYKYAYENNYDIAIQMDGDGQHMSEYIRDLLYPIIVGDADLAVGSRFIEREGFQSSWQRRIGILLLSELIYFTCGKKIKDVTSGFRAANKAAIELFVKEYATDYPEPESLVAGVMLGLRVVEIPVKMRDRQGGVSSISPIKSIYYMIKVSIAIILSCAVKGRAKS